MAHADRAALPSALRNAQHNTLFAESRLVHAAAVRSAARAIPRSMPPKMSPCTGYSAYQ